MKRVFRTISAFLILALVALVALEWRASYTTSGIRESWLQTPYGVDFGTEAFGGQFQFSYRLAKYRRDSPWEFYQSTHRTWGVGFDKTFLGISWGRTLLASKTSPSTDSVWIYLTLPC